jgi:hypothetical protein
MATGPDTIGRHKKSETLLTNTLISEGALIGIAGRPVQVRNHNGTGVETQEGPFLSASLPVAGFAVVEAADLAEAVKKVSGVPCAVAHGVVEVWPLE